ncbi:MAG: argininosuccinate lyase [Acidimicrobiia bacterium]
MTLWGGRFKETPATPVWSYTTDSTDRRLLMVDVEGSLAHVEMLGQVGILTATQSAALLDGLSIIRDEAEQDSFLFKETDEDVHTAVERRLIELVGEVGEMLHTGRSRNDQIALDLRLYLRRAAEERIAQIDTLIEVFCTRALEQADVVVASYTHLQPAQKISLGHHLLAYAWMLTRDAERFAEARKRIAVSPLGAGAGGGSGLPVDPSLTAAHLGIVPFENSLDAVSARDFAAEYVFCCAQLMAHLSRLSEDLVLWASSEFGWIKLPDSMATGSSALPQKRNPDVPELARARTAPVIGDLTALLALQKGLPLSYNRDLQEDKPAVFDADEVAAATLQVLAALMETVVFQPPPPPPETGAVDLAEALVGRGLSHRRAHGAVGELILRLEQEGRSLTEVTEQDLAGSPIEAQDLVVLDLAWWLGRVRSRGAGSADDVRRQVDALRRIISER